MRNISLSLILLATTPTFAQPAGYRSLDDLGNPPAGARSVQVFEAKAGTSLQSTLNAWARAAGWAEPRWDLPKATDFVLASTVRFEGDYKTATRSFIGALGSEANLRVVFDEPARQAVISPRTSAP